MAFDEGLAQRIRECLEGQGGVDEKRMFGGLAFLLNGNMCCGVVNERLMVRVGPEAYADALAAEGASEMDFTGKPLKGFVYVDSPVIDADTELAGWVSRGVRFASSLPPK